METIEAPDATTGNGDAEVNDTAEVHTSHFKNGNAHSALVRFGVPLWILATLVLLINADIAGGVSADYIIRIGDEISQEDALLVASIFSSVKELWHNGSYPLAILIAVTSIAWPYLKLLLTAYAWFMPYKNPRGRERLVEVLDACGKWSFVDIIVLVEIMVAFRQTIVIGQNVYVEIVVRALWGFYGFVLATMMSLLSTHIILHFHRDLHYHNSAKKHTEEEENSGQEQTIADDKSEDAEQTGETGQDISLGGSTKVVVGLAVLVAISIYLVGCLVDIYEVNNARGVSEVIVQYSVVSVGQDIPQSSFGDDSDVGNRFIQVMWFFLSVAMPLWCSFLFGILYLVPMSRALQERIFAMGEIAFAWSCAEVLLVSTLFSVLQMPTFGEGLIESGCSQCFVDATILPPIAWLVVGTVLNVGTNVWLYRKAHEWLYGS